MSKREMREARRGTYSAAGDVGRELAELDRLQEAGKKIDSEVGTITVGCGALFTILCC